MLAMKTLKELIDHEVLAWIPAVSNTVHSVRLRGVENRGIWVESEHLTQSLLHEVGHAAGKTPIVFVPYSRIMLLMQADDKVSLSEKAFGV